MTEPRTGPRCPICEKPRNARYRPFCSRRCQEIDLGRWFSGAYAVPAAEPPDDFDGSTDDAIEDMDWGADRPLGDPPDC